jgi:hypothetical protein
LELGTGFGHTCGLREIVALCRPGVEGGPHRV